MWREGGPAGCFQSQLGLLRITGGGVNSSSENPGKRKEKEAITLCYSKKCCSLHISERIQKCSDMKGKNKTHFRKEETMTIKD